MLFRSNSQPDGVSVPIGGYHLSKTGLDGHRYRIGHPLAQHVIANASSRKLNGAELIFDYSAWPQKAVSLEPYVGKSGTMTVQKLSVRGSDDQDHIIIAAITDEGLRLKRKAAMRLFELPSQKNGQADLEVPAPVKRVVENERKAILDELATRQATWFDEEMDKLDNWAEDKRAGLKADLKDLDEQIKALKKEIRQIGNLPDKLVRQKKIRPLEKKRDEAWRAYDAAAKEIEVQKDNLLDQVEARLGQQVSEETLFTVRFSIL